MATLTESPTSAVRTAARRTRAAYSHGEHRPLGSFAALIGIYSAGAGALVLAGRVIGVPERPAWSDLAIAAIATQRTSRLITKDAVTSVLRSPVASYGDSEAPGETNDQPRGTGPRRAVGELLTCPFCIGQWVGTAWVAGLAFAPRATRWAAAAMSVVAAADVVQFGWAKLEQSSH
jgi:Protein of unknown function (DUF1360)